MKGRLVLRMKPEDISSRAAELLLRRIHDPGLSTTVVTLQPELVVRQSCGGPRAEGFADTRART